MSDIGVGVGQTFTTRPELQGMFGMVSSTHWLASATGMRMLELGGNAFDAAVAAGFVLQVVQPHLNGPGGDLPIVLWDKRVGQPEVLCAQGVAPAAATPALFRSLGIDVIPGTGLLAACVPGAMDGWLLLLRDRGTMSLRQVLEPAVGYARNGYTVSHDMSRTIYGARQMLAEEWPTSAAIYLTNGEAPRPGATFRNVELARTYERLIEASVAGGGRERGIDHARRAFYDGFVAKAIVSYVQHAEVLDATGRRHRGLLTHDDLASWTASWEEPLTYRFRNVVVCKAGPWSQAPVLLQQLALLDGFPLQSMASDGPEYIHTVVEASKLAYADREAWYADPLFADVPMAALLSAEYAASRRTLIGDRCSFDHRPGSPLGRTPRAARTTGRGSDQSADGSSLVGIGEPTVTVGELSFRADSRSNIHAQDTCHVDVTDRFGNMISATPSGGWLQSSPVIPGLGFALGTRIQMFDVDEGSLNQVQPGKRPRTTLSPTLALRDGEPWLAFGTPGGDQQDQWSLQFLLNVIVFGDDLQLAIDRPVFQSAHFPSSFYPRQSAPGRVYMEDRYPEETLAELRRRGHDVLTAGPWSLTRVCAVGRTPSGMLRGAANPRGMEAYAVGR